MELYHGTTKDAAESIVNKVDVTKGGGELGRGFYMGNACCVAARWAYHKSIQLNKIAAVIVFDVPDDVQSHLDTVVLKLNNAKRMYMKIRRNKECGTYLFDKDLVIANIVGNKKYYVNKQYKYESITAENYVDSLTKQINVFK